MHLPASAFCVSPCPPLLADAQHLWDMSSCLAGAIWFSRGFKEHTNENLRELELGYNEVGPPLLLRPAPAPALLPPCPRPAGSEAAGQGCTDWPTWAGPSRSLAALSGKKASFPQPPGLAVPRPGPVPSTPGSRQPALLNPPCSLNPAAADQG